MNKNIYYVLGVMSGTSLDGVDVALLRFELDDSWTYRILTADTISYPAKWQRILAEAITYDDAHLDELDAEYTSYLSAIISDFIERHQITGLDAVCSHGHTIKHEPEKGFTLQIGNLPDLAENLKQTVVCDFRVQDVEMGGQGAPLVPVGDEFLFPEYEFCLNLGGFANVSTKKGDERIAFDICAVNTVLNFLAGKKGFLYDKNGSLAASGTLNHELLAELDALDFYSQHPPKSLGIEWVRKYIFPLLTREKEIETALHTYTIHVASQIAAVLDQRKGSKVLVTGGGAFNSFLLREIKKRTAKELVIPGSDTVNFKEALIFGFLGVLRLRNEINVFSTVTGAGRDHSSGKIFRYQN